MTQCKNGTKQEVKQINNPCFGSHLIFDAKTREDKEFMVSNNINACENCLYNLTAKERKICELVE